VALCGYCQTVVAQRNLNVEALGRVSALPPDQTPLQIGAVGKVAGKQFSLIGRIRVTWGNGAWNEWYAHFGDGHYGWVAETQGFFIISWQLPLPPGLLKVPGLTVAGRTIHLPKGAYHVVDAKNAQALGGEGELPFAPTDELTWQTVELAGENQRFISLQRFDAKVLVNPLKGLHEEEGPKPAADLGQPLDEIYRQEQIRDTEAEWANNAASHVAFDREAWGDDSGQKAEYQYYEGIYCNAEDISWEGLRPVPGWMGEPLAMEKNATEAFPCPKCGGQITLRAQGASQSVVCSHCGGITDLTSEVPKVLQIFF
jgi:predicted RNA-binding Zn-ribbon protein involved in translation (DUF1610 family)